MSKKRLTVLKWCVALAAGLAAAGAAIVLAFPTPAPTWLSIKGTGDDTSANAYYAAMSAPATFADWKAAYGFDAGPEAHAIYYNAGDLGFGRDMHCRRHDHDSTYEVACYVNNHGLGAGTPPGIAVDSAVQGIRRLPTVAMVYDHALDGQPNAVKFYIYDNDGARINAVPLDSQGDKFVPYLCLPCHGGNYLITDTVQGANFLPFDVHSFRYSAQSGYTQADQADALRQLNALVRDTNPAPLIADLINGWYASHGVDDPASVFDDSYVLPGYDNNNLDDKALYYNVVKPYCRSCHIAQNFNLQDVNGVNAAPYAVYNQTYMPHAELTNHNFWSGTAPAFLANNRHWAIHVTITGDPTPDGCAVNGCSLREAILAANSGLAPNGMTPAVITFDINGTFTLSRAGVNENAASTGDLDITTDTMILGNGAANTIINGAGVDRVFHVLPGVKVLIQRVTITGGNTNSAGGLGGGILNDGGNLTLNFDVVRNNQTTLDANARGGGLAARSLATTEINETTIGPGNISNSLGGGIYNSGSALTLNSSTIGENIANSGGGIYNVLSSAVLTMTHGTVVYNSGSAVGTGGGLVNASNAVMNVSNSLISGNYGFDGTNTVPGDCQLAGTYNSLGFNLVGQNGSDNGCTPGPDDTVLPVGIDQTLNPNLSTYSAGVRYYPVLATSPSIDNIPVGDNCRPPSYDDRNQPRPVQAAWDRWSPCDTGAHEFVDIAVTTSADVVADDGQCTLREAVIAANTGLPSGVKGGECPAGPDLIELATAGPYDLVGGQLTVTGNVAIQGHGYTIRRTAGNARIFEVRSGGFLSLANVTVRDGSRTGTCVGDVNSGGGLLIDPNGRADIVNTSFVNNNTSCWGGGVNNLGLLNIANSTFSGNLAAVDSGGLNNRGTALLTHVTVAGNTSDADNNGFGEGGGVGAFGGSTFFKNSLIAGNSDLSGNRDVYVSPSAIEIFDDDYNLIGDTTGSAGNFTGAHDLLGTSGSPLDPQLDPLAGGPPVYPLRATSPAVDVIPPDACTFRSSSNNPLYADAAAVATDERGTGRPANGACDVGAFELAYPVYMPLILR